MKDGDYMDKVKSDEIEIIVTENGELIVDFNLIEIDFDIPDIETPDLSDEF